MREIRKLSNSALERFTQCPLSFFHQYVNEERPGQEGVESFYADYGILMHFLVEMYPRTNLYKDSLPFKPSNFVDDGDINGILNGFANQLMEREEPLTLEQMLIIYDELFPLVQFPSQEKRDEYYDQGLTYIKNIPAMDWSKVIGLEAKFKIDLQNGVVPIKGFIDKVERDDKGLIVTDYKTSKPYSHNAIMAKPQLPIYGMACFLMYGELPYKYRYDFVRFGRVVEVEIPIERLTEVKNVIKFKYMQMLAYQRQGSFPAQYQDFYCKNFCGFNRLCDRYKQFNGG
ncbi:hypothetical protein BXO87_02315 [Bacillus sp. GZB]|uniref:RecB family exonuclease n=1 Tax=Bacillus TaxID=1386 RepID=UPI00097845AC|nr:MULTISPECIES: PD-(D/E)XK nuclease family protein [Bacillus]MCZ4246956.1 PD-(D/E)XK nuclease family protein [Bacillus amyloliquefaciens]OMQ06860.1 hypothetical protein BXO87_02315 [Bacillus sp. GZB]